MTVFSLGVGVSVVSHPELFHPLVPDPVGSDFCKEDGVDGHHGDGRSPVLVNETKS